MKKPASRESNRSRQPGAGGIRKTTAPTDAMAKRVKLSPARTQEPVKLLEERFSKDGEVHAVILEYFNPNAREVSVAGTFNDWQSGAAPMIRKRGGRWWTELLLQPGLYEYRFVVDGQWQDDPMAARFVANPFGGLNSVVEVKPAGTAATGRTQSF